MAIALIFAGGAGKRMNSRIRPKQFLELNGKAIIIHTLEYFERHEEIESIAVVCIADWIDYFKNLLKKNFITKVKWVVPGGLTGQESIYNGLKIICTDCKESEKEIILIHDGVRPLISEKLITDSIKCVKKYGSAITISSASETVITVEDEEVVCINNRDVCKIAKAPQSFILSNIVEAHHRAINDGINNMTDSATLMNHYNYRLHTLEGPSENIKITTPADFYIFRAIFEARENSQILGITE